MTENTTESFQQESSELFDTLNAFLAELENHPDNTTLAKRTLQGLKALKVVCSISGQTHAAGAIIAMLSHLEEIKQQNKNLSSDIIQFALSTLSHIQDRIQHAFDEEQEEDHKSKELSQEWQKLPCPSTPDTALSDKEPPKKTTRAAILIVDDEDINRMLIEETVKSLRKNAKIISVASAEEGLYHYFTSNIGLVFLDIMMPNINGDDFLQVIQKNRDSGNLTNRPNIVIQTGVQSLEHLMSYVKLECIQEVIRKPIPYERIVECIERYCPACTEEGEK